MARRFGTPPPDFHLWHEVTETVTPLRLGRGRLRLDSSALPLPPVASPRPKPSPQLAMPSYQSSNRPGAPQGPGLEPRLRRRLGRGQIEIDGRLDLHGMRQSEAHAALTRFITARAGRGDRTVLVITGKGLKKLDGDATTIVERGVLRTMLPIWLQESPLAQLVSGWDQAHQSHGGEGAWYVRLRAQPQGGRP